ncbi:MAG TPA: 16S rRNA (adenine(1518)-N(6)/adenine(1519)-N(6))-dimethyltransferase RsmA, partial [Nodosilinea sp.]|nr:16S rRNA (adenine(1518)-N(6)/adenine(1519)-N(6))-dimethyltransferase RsmA [Nodosilinea sp.]
AVEIDRDLVRKLNNQFAKHDNFRLVPSDILELDIAAVSRDKNFDYGLPNKVVANIPYYITGPILEKLLGTLAAPNPAPYDAIVLLVQKEVAQRLYARPGRRDFGALSVRVQYLADCELVCPVPARAFQPPPQVDSAVVKLTPRPPTTPSDDLTGFDRLVKLGFGSKRKMLRNNLKGVIDRDELEVIMTSLAIKPTARAEDLGVEQWVALSNTILKHPR